MIKQVPEADPARQASSAAALKFNGYRDISKLPVALNSFTCNDERRIRAMITGELQFPISRRTRWLALGGVVGPCL